MASAPSNPKELVFLIELSLPPSTLADPLAREHGTSTVYILYSRRARLKFRSRRMVRALAHGRHSWIHARGIPAHPDVLLFPCRILRLPKKMLKRIIITSHLPSCASALKHGRVRGRIVPTHGNTIVSWQDSGHAWWNSIYFIKYIRGVEPNTKILITFWPSSSSKVSRSGSNPSAIALKSQVTALGSICPTSSHCQSCPRCIRFWFD